MNQRRPAFRFPRRLPGIGGTIPYGGHEAAAGVETTLENEACLSRSTQVSLLSVTASMGEKSLPSFRSAHHVSQHRQ